jgi:Gas vesicle protein
MSPGVVRDPKMRRPAEAREIALVDLIDRLLDGGVVIHGDITLAVADVDLLYVGLRALVASVNTIEEKMGVRLSAHSAVLDNDRLDVDAFGSDSLGSSSLRSDALDSDPFDSDALDSNPFRSGDPRE